MTARKTTPPADDIPAAARAWLRAQGAKGGRAGTEAQNEARRANGAKGGRPRKVRPEAEPQP